MNEIRRNYNRDENFREDTYGDVNRYSTVRKTEEDIKFNKFQKNLDTLILDFKDHLENIKNIKASNRTNSFGDHRQAKSKKYEKYFDKHVDFKSSETNRNNFSKIDPLRDFEINKEQYINNAKTIEEKLENARNMNLSIKDTYKKIKSSSEMFSNTQNPHNTIKNSDTQENQQSSNNLNNNNNNWKYYELNSAVNNIYDNHKNKNENNYNYQNENNLLHSPKLFGEKEKTNLNESIQTYQASFITDIKKQDNIQFENSINNRDERIRHLNEKNSENEIKIFHLNKIKNILLQSIEKFINKFNLPNTRIVKRDLQFDDSNENEIDNLLNKFLDMESYFEDLIYENNKLKGISNVHDLNYHSRNYLENNDFQSNRIRGRDRDAYYSTNRSRERRNLEEPVNIPDSNIRSLRKFKIESENNNNYEYSRNNNGYYSPRNLTFNKFPTENEFQKKYENNHSKYNSPFRNSREKDYNINYRLNSDPLVDQKFHYYANQNIEEEKLLKDKYYLSTSYKHQENYEKLDQFNKKIINIKNKIEDINNDQREKRILESLRRFRETNNLKY